MLGQSRVQGPQKIRVQPSGDRFSVPIDMCRAIGIDPHVAGSDCRILLHVIGNHGVFLGQITLRSGTEVYGLGEIVKANDEITITIAPAP